jgi:DNA-binding NarL/FixJ family response regulator
MINLHNPKLNDEPSIKTLHETVKVINQVVIRLQEIRDSTLKLINQLKSPEPTCINDMPERLYLSPREISILKLAGQGKTNSEIARELGLKESYIKGVVCRLYNKLEIKDRAGLVLYAIKTGIVTINIATNP